MKILKTVFALMALGLILLACNELKGPEVELSGQQEVEFRGTEAYPWNDHAAPFDFLFGNGMDNHFQGKVSNGGRLNGFLYISYTGEYTANGYPKAVPGNTGNYTVGWIVQGIPVQARLVDMGQGGGHGGGHDGGHDDGGHDGGHDDGGHDDGHDDGGHDDGGHDDGGHISGFAGSMFNGFSSGRFRMTYTTSSSAGGGHDSGSHGGPPEWCIDPADLPVPPGYTFFHWEGELRRGNPEVGKIYNGYLMKLTAREKFYLDKRGGWYIRPGIDYDSHDNVNNDCD